MSTAIRPRTVPGSKELRIALVCYGGVSLAIYMHGVTKEIQKLVAASAAYDLDAAYNPFDEGTTERVYWEALSRRSASEGVSTRVVVDIIAGTSAGGINGVVLAKALAHGLSQDELRDLWMDRADIEQLLDKAGIPAPGGSTRFRLAWKGSNWLLFKGLSEARSTVFDKDKQPQHPLRGDEMLRWVYDALAGMDEAPLDPPRHLVPNDHTLRLFVTVTDYYGYTRRLPLHDPSIVLDSDHRHVMEFRFDGGGDPAEGGSDQFGPKYNGALAFAARATSSFPGGFPPISFGSLASNIGGPTEPLAEFFEIYRASGMDPEKTWFVDGGVLDNFPLAHAIEAIIDAPANSEVERYLVYLEPDPGNPAGSPNGAEPHWLSNIWSALSRIPSKEPIIDDIEMVGEFNDRVRQVNELINAAEDQVTASLEQGDPYRSGGDLKGLAYDNYVWLKLESVIDRLGYLAAKAAGWPDRSPGSLIVKDIVRRWARQPDGIGTRTAGQTLSDAQIDFLKTFDLDYGRRRLRFVVQGINDLYGSLDGDPPSRDNLDNAKNLLYGFEARLDVDRLLTSDRGRELTDGTAALFSRSALERARLWGPAPGDIDGPEDMVGEFVAANADALDALYALTTEFLNDDLEGFREEVDTAVEGVMSSWSEQAQHTIRLRFAGFPIWDSLVFPIRRFGDVGELYPINVVRFSPHDSTEISDAGATKLTGAQWHHFGAFFTRPGRENDYLWGRLDAAERLIRLLGDATDSDYDEAFRAIIDQEREALSEEAVGPIESKISERG